MANKVDRDVDDKRGAHRGTDVMQDNRDLRCGVVLIGVLPL